MKIYHFKLIFLNKLV